MSCKKRQGTDALPVPLIAKRHIRPVLSGVFRSDPPPHPDTTQLPLVPAVVRSSLDRDRSSMH